MGFHSVESVDTCLLYCIRDRPYDDFFFMKTNPNFDTNAPPFEIRGCKDILGGAFFNSGGCKQKIQNMSNLQELHRFSQ